MKSVYENIEVSTKAIQSLHEAICLYGEYKNKEPKMVLTFQDSVLCRFKYTTHVFMKTLYVFLTKHELLLMDEFMSLHDIIRDAVSSRIITEQEGKICQNIISKRNETSHIYHEEVAEDIMEEVPEFYATMKAILQRMKQRISE
jgi:hypothetical protein